MVTLAGAFGVFHFAQNMVHLCEGQGLIGTHGSVRWNGGEQIQVELVAEPGGFISKTKSVDLPSLTDSCKTQGHRSLIAEFAECVREKKIPDTIAKDNIKSLSMVFGAIESATLGKRIELA